MRLAAETLAAYGLVIAAAMCIWFADDALRLVRGGVEWWNVAGPLGRSLAIAGGCALVAVLSSRRVG